MAKKRVTKPEDKKSANKSGRRFFSLVKEKAPESFDIGKYDTTWLKAGSLKFTSLYGRNSTWKRYLIAITVGLVMGLVVQLMIKNTGLYNSGLSAIIQGFARLSNTLMVKSGNLNDDTIKLIFNLMFWGLYIVFNIPLFVFGYKKIGKTFALLTLVFICVNSLFGLSLSYIPGIDKIFLFGNTIAEGTHAGAITGNPNVFVGGAGANETWWPNYNINNIPFWYVEKPSAGLEAGQIFNADYDPYKALLLFIYAIVYGLIASISYAILYIIGGCSAGSDFVSIYYSSIKHKPLGGLMIIVNSSLMIIGSIIGSYISAGLVNSQGFNFAFFLSANLVASFLSVLMFGLLLNRFFPMHKIVKVEIISECLFAIRDHLFASKFTHSMSVARNMGAYSQKDKDILWTICMYIEVPNIIRHIRAVDPKALITVSTIIDIDGNLKVYRQGSTD